MWKAITDFIEARRERSEKRRFDAGYSYAVGELRQRGEPAKEVLLQHVEAAKDFGSATAFDNGILAAIDTFERAPA